MPKKVQKSKIDLFVAHRVKEMRGEKNLTQEDIAFELGISSSSFIGSIESPRSDARYNVKHLNALAKILQCSPKDFLPEEPI